MEDETEGIEYDVFTLKITMGNAAMLTPEDVAKELRRVSRMLDKGRTSGNTIDVNGNRVGTYELE